MASEVWFHVDLDAFFAAVEQLDRPELAGKPVIVGAQPGKRGVVSACSYEARAFGVRSAMPVSEAYRRCPQGVFVPVRMRRYQEVSRTVMRVLNDFSPVVRPISIDEAFLDMSGTSRLFGPPWQAARRLKDRVKSETGLILSVGIGTSRFIAKMASDFGKPDGLVEVPPGRESRFLEELELGKIWGIGKKTVEKLAEFGLNTVQDVRNTPAPALASLLGTAAGDFLHKAVRGIDPGIYSETTKSRSTSAETTFQEDISDQEALRNVLLELSQQVMFRCLEDNDRSRTVVLKLRYADFSSLTAHKTLPRRILSTEDLFQAAQALFNAKWTAGRAVRLLGVGLANLEKADEPDQPSLFADPAEKQHKVELAVLGIRKKMPQAKLTKASLLNATSKRKHGDSDDKA